MIGTSVMKELNPRIYNPRKFTNRNAFPKDIITWTYALLICYLICKYFNIRFICTDHLLKQSSQFPILYTPENTRKPRLFWCLQGLLNGNTDQKWVKTNVCSQPSFDKNSYWKLTPSTLFWQEHPTLKTFRFCFASELAAAIHNWSMKSSAKFIRKRLHLVSF